jgi:type IV secretion system protein VirB9
MTSVIVVASLLGLATHARAQERLGDAALLEATMRQQWLGIDEQVKLRRIDREALSVARTVHEAERDPAPTESENGHVVFEFGRGVPRIFCTPFRVCDIALQAGEIVQGAPMIGDGEGWHIDSAISGNIQHVVIKPKIHGISTNIAVYTNRRVYHLEIVATASDLMPMVSFTYPEDRRAKWLQLAQQQSLAANDGAEHRSAGRPDEYEVSVRPGALDFNYAVMKEGRWLMRRRIDWLPKRAYDDGEKVIIEMPRTVLARELPVLFVRDGDGSDKLVNYRVKGTHFIVDRMFTHAVLVKGIGFRQERVGIHKESD